jgi:hypothetical protein
MRTAAIRVTVASPDGAADSLARFAAAARDLGITVADRPAGGAGECDLHLSMATPDPAELARHAQRLCVEVFGVSAQLGVPTFVSRGTDEDAYGVLDALGIDGDVTRVRGADGYDTVTVRISRANLARIPESRIHTALEAALNCEVRIIPAG